MIRIITRKNKHLIKRNRITLINLKQALYGSNKINKNQTNEIIRKKVLKSKDLSKIKKVVSIIKNKKQQQQQQQQVQNQSQQQESIITTTTNNIISTTNENNENNNLPFGKIKKSQLIQGYKILLEIQNYINIQKNNISRGKLIDYTTRFYTIVPHCFGDSIPPIIDTCDIVKSEINLIEISLNFMNNQQQQIQIQI